MRSLPLLCLLLGGVSCATQREQRLSSAEARQRPTDEPCEPTGPAPGPGYTWACGYWHWDAVRYVWVDGKWQPPAPPAR
jgi:hypothetical protein